MTETKKTGNRKLLIGCVCAAVLAAVLCAVWFFTRPKTVVGAKNVTVEVTDDAGKTVSYAIDTDQEYLRGVMDELSEKEDFSYEGEDSEYGVMINTVNGLPADYNVDQSYWSIMVNGEYGEYGADSQPVADGDTFGLVYTKE